MSNKPHTPMCDWTSHLEKKKNTLTKKKKKNSVIQAWHVGDNSDLMSVLAASVECRQWLTKHFWVQGTVVLKENSDDLHLIAAKPRASARPAPHARSDRLSYLPWVWRPYARALPLTPEEVRFLTKRRCKYDIQTSVPIQPEPSKPVRDRRDAGRVCKCATSLCGTLCACRMDDFLTFWNNFHKIIIIIFFYYFITERNRGKRNKIRIGKSYKTDSKSRRPHERLCAVCWSTCTTDHICDTFSW